VRVPESTLLPGDTGARKQALPYTRAIFHPLAPVFFQKIFWETLDFSILVVILEGYLTGTCCLLKAGKVLHKIFDSRFVEKGGF
jgi:hypothetical protein